MKPTLRIACTCLMLLLTLPAAAQSNRLSGQIALSPQNFIIDLDKGMRVHAYRLINQGSLPVRIAVDLQSFELDEANQIVAVAPDETSLENWIVVNPLEIEIPPGESRVVRFSIRPAIPLPPGEHRTLMVFEQIPDPTAMQTRPDDEQGTLTFMTQFRIQSAIYATVGPIERSGRVEDIRLEADSLWLQVKATGNGHVRLSGDFAVWPDTAEGRTAAAAWRAHLSQPPAEREAPDDPATGLRHGRLAAVPVMPGTKRWLRLPLTGEPLAPGRYRVELVGKIGDQPITIEPGLLERPLIISGD